MTTMVLNPEFIFTRIANGNGYFVSKILTVPADGATNMHIRNPHPDKDMWLAAIDITATGDQHIMMHDGFDSITDGTEITIQNALLDEGGAGALPDSGPFEAFYDSTFTTATDATVPIGITESSNPNTKIISYFPAVLEKDREVVIDVQNQGSNQQTALISILLVTSY